MALADLIVDTRPRIGFVTLDVAISILHSDSTRLTRYPVEKGADLTDHAIDDPPRLSIEGLVSQTPTRISDRLQLNPIRHLTAYQALQALRRLRRPFFVFTAIRAYPNMMITRLEVPQAAGAGDSLRFRCQLERVTTPTTLLEDAVADSVEGQAASGADVGTQGTTEAAGPISDAAIGAAS